MWFRRETASVYNFGGVSRHKKLFHPIWEPTHIRTTQMNASDQVLDIFSLIGLIPPEAVNALFPEMMELLEIH
jgi:lysylphosphatidylglycerol synthetase-like protein (DUF2156 family)